MTVAAAAAADTVDTDGVWMIVVARVTVWGTTWVATEAGELEAEAIIVDSMVAV